jgi:hypothetical protein
LNADDPPRVCAVPPVKESTIKPIIISRKTMTEINHRFPQMKIPHENGGSSLTLKTTNIRA